MFCSLPRNSRTVGSSTSSPNKVLPLILNAVTLTLRPGAPSAGLGSSTRGRTSMPGLGATGGCFVCSSKLPASGFTCASCAGTLALKNASMKTAPKRAALRTQSPATSSFPAAEPENRFRSKG